MFLDDFDGAAGSGVNTADWQYTTGTGYPGGPANFGTGEIETMTADPSNVSLDGAGNLRITPRRDAAGNWTSGRIETRRSDFQPPAAWHAPHRGAHPDAERHGPGGQGLLVGVLDARSPVPRQLVELARHR